MVPYESIVTRRDFSHDILRLIPQVPLRVRSGMVENDLLTERIIDAAIADPFPVSKN